VKLRYTNSRKCQ